MPPFVPGFVPGTNRVVPGTNPVNRVKQGENPGLSQVFTGFVPGTNPVKSPGQTRGRPQDQPEKKKIMFMCLFLA